MTALLDAGSAEGLTALPASPLQADLAEHNGWAAAHSDEPQTLHRAVILWTRLHGVLSLELAGHFAGMGFDPAVLYAAEVEAVAGG